MNMIRKAGCTILVVSGLMLETGVAQAALVNFSLTGDVDAWADSGNSYGLNMGDTISATGTFDDGVLTGGTGTVSFGSGSGNSLTLNVGSFTFTAVDDVNYATGYPQMSLNAGAFDGLNVAISFGTSSSFDSLNTWFDAYDDGGNLVSGTWTSFQMTPVPVPAAVWLFGSGLLGLAGVARRKQNKK